MALAAWLVLGMAVCIGVILAAILVAVRPAFRTSFPLPIVPALVLLLAHVAFMHPIGRLAVSGLDVVLVIVAAWLGHRARREEARIVREGMRHVNESVAGDCNEVEERAQQQGGVVRPLQLVGASA